MPYEVALFVEGADDEKFFEDLIQYMDLSEVRIQRIGGGISNIHQVEPQIRRRYNEGYHVAVVVDADADFRVSLEQFIEVKTRLDLPIADVFLLPDHQGPGCLETLVVSAAAEDHQGLHRCFTEYETCIRGQRPEYSLPAVKGKVYAYREALGIVRREKLDYSDGRYWNLDAAILNRLKEFLRRNVG